MPHGSGSFASSADSSDPILEATFASKAPRDADVYVQAAAFYVACLKAGFLEEATEFAEWYLDTFDTDLED